MLVIGLSVAAVAMGWFSLLSPDQNALAALLPAQLVAGVGLGIGFVAATIGGVRNVAPQDSGVASGLINTSQQVGGALGLAVLRRRHREPGGRHDGTGGAHQRLHHRPAQRRRVLPGRHPRRPLPPATAPDRPGPAAGRTVGR
ncbi:hypothetical protein [Actinoallomurus iriomotensis]|uniref:Major facilitator superfamily (MFS) profile domain-containing protein n=1 Tax=Actinoallomurus iriomotensis TaxID=478107 RepID=A0A9W6S3L3_9ACTN|nr:hypothetical protein [Actinoallomurus iriomotensis]GLY87540.1 hypothetical protein Airi02_054690 [Actinoallomurus iriomotensis]